MIDKHSQTIAIVDDDDAVLDSCRFILELNNIPVSVYSSALALLESDIAQVMGLIVDQHMPMMTGLELAAKLRAEGLDIPVMLITSSPSAAILARAREIGVWGVLEKPPGESDLIAFIRSCEAPPP